MAVPRRVYWDTSCFISYISGTHPDEVTRAEICEDMLRHARSGDIEIWTSVFTMVETIRPKAQSRDLFPLPVWAELLDTRGKDGVLLYPNAVDEFQKIWSHYKKQTLPSRLISEADVLKIKGMFEWPWVKKVDLVPAIAHKATEISRTYNMKADSIHVASALARQCEVLYRWDRDYRKTDVLIPSRDPEKISPQSTLSLG